MDVYGAFQLCSIGLLVATVTVKESRTYFDDPGEFSHILLVVMHID